MCKIGLIPLDSRPCNTLWVEDLARIGQAEVVMYPREKCGTLHKGAQLDDMLDWLKATAPSLDYLIISSDGLCFGGLIQARQAKIDVKETIKKVDIIKTIKHQYPNLRIYLFDTVMRTSITAYDEETQKYWSKMNQFSLLKGKVHLYQQPSDQEALAALEAEIPTHIIETYLNARNKKLQINKYFLSLVHDNIIEDMILLQEDSMPDGIQVIDQQQLQTDIEKYNISSKVEFYNGTDEGAVILLGKIFLSEKRFSPKVYLHLPNENSLNKVFPFEDRPFSENLEKMAKTIGFTFTTSLEESDFVLSIFSENVKHDLNLSKFEVIKPLQNNEYLSYIKSLNEIIKSGKKVALVDLLFANGGSIDLLNAIDYRSLTVYSAWNTASNAMGSALAQMAVVLGDYDKLFNKKFLYERIFDDCVYQYYARRKTCEELISKNVNIFNLADANDDATNITKKYLEEYHDMIDGLEYKISLPWKRMFEVEIDIKVK